MSSTSASTHETAESPPRQYPAFLANTRILKVLVKALEARHVPSRQLSAPKWTLGIPETMFAIAPAPEKIDEVLPGLINKISEGRKDHLISPEKWLASFRAQGTPDVIAAWTLYLFNQMGLLVVDQVTTRIDMIQRTEGCQESVYHSGMYYTMEGHPVVAPYDPCLPAGEIPIGSWAWCALAVDWKAVEIAQRQLAVLANPASALTSILPEAETLRGYLERNETEGAAEQATKVEELTWPFTMMFKKGDLSELTRTVDDIREVAWTVARRPEQLERHQSAELVDRLRKAFGILGGLNRESRPPANNDKSRRLFTLQEIADHIGYEKRTLQDWDLPAPDLPSRGRKPARFHWTTIRPALVAVLGEAGVPQQPPPE